MLPWINGVKVLNKMKENPALQQMPVVVLTAHAMQGDEQKFIDAGCRGYISKPIDVPNFLGEVHSIFRKGA